MCRFAPQLLTLLERLGIVFDRTPEGYPEKKISPGSSQARTFHAGQTLAMQINVILSGQIRRFAQQGLIRILSGWDFASALIDFHGVCRGVIAQNRRNLSFAPFAADSTIMAATAPHALFDPDRAVLGATGAALGQLYRQGLPLANLEFVDYAVEDEEKPVYRDFGGGLWVDKNFKTPTKGLWAIGESQFGGRGARTLPGNAILIELYSAWQAVQDITITLNQDLLPAPRALEKYFSQEIKKQEMLVLDYLDMSGPENIHRLHAELSGLLAQTLAVPRYQESLVKLLSSVRFLKERFLRSTLTDKSRWMNGELLFARHLDCLLDVALAVVVAAQERQETRGCHLRSDFPQTHPEAQISRIYYHPQEPHIDNLESKLLEQAVAS
jgi:succinate dehydrogenase/fumarate reductase flavoprotein subunit